MGAVRSRVCAFVCVNLLATAAWAAESTTYTYDALGRLVTTSVSGGPSSGVQTSTSFDPAGNRTNQAVTGAPPSGPSFSIADLTVTEGGVATVTVSRGGPIWAAGSVSYSTANGTATAPADYAAASGTLAFAAGEASRTVAISTVDDSLFEGTESFSVNLASPSGGTTINDGSAVVTIEDNDGPPMVSIAGAAVNEGAVATLTVTRSGATGAALTVSYATANGTAVAPDDFTAASSTLTFAAGETSKTITVATVNDAVYENAESFTVGLSDASGATIDTGTATVSIADNDTVPVFSIADVPVTEGGSAVLTVTKSGATSMSSSVNYGTSNGTAVAPDDFTATSGALTFAADETSKTIAVATTNDAVYENAESFTVGLSAASAAMIGTATAAVSISDNDAAPTFSIAGATVTEGGTAVLTVTKAGATAVPASVNYATADGTATAPIFYAAKSGNLYFAAAETSKTISIDAVENPYYDGNKAFSVNLSGASGAGISVASAPVTIGDNEPAPTINVSNASVSGVAEGGNQEFRISIQGSPRNPIAVNYATSSGTANSGVDFASTSGSVLVAQFEVKSVSVATIDDTEIESNETFTMTISSPDGFAATQSQVTATITNNDFVKQPPVANPDNAGSMPKCGSVTLNPITNDTDPDGDYPLSLVSVSGGGFEKIISGNTVTLNHLGAGTTGAKTLTYVVSDSSGATASGTITVTITGGSSCS